MRQPGEQWHPKSSIPGSDRDSGPRLPPEGLFPKRLSWSVMACWPRVQESKKGGQVLFLDPIDGEEIGKGKSQKARPDPGSADHRITSSYDKLNGMAGEIPAATRSIHLTAVMN
jgi:hypothetical protein